MIERDYREPRTAERTRAEPGLEAACWNQMPKTSEWREPRLYRYEATDLYQWWAHRNSSPFEDPFGEPFVIERRR